MGVLWNNIALWIIFFEMLQNIRALTTYEKETHFRWQLCEIRRLGKRCRIIIKFRVSSLKCSTYFDLYFHISFTFLAINLQRLKCINWFKIACGVNENISTTILGESSNKISTSTYICLLHLDHKVY